jgi:hypothetical protein
MEIRTNEQATGVVYEPPVLVKVGEFSEDTLAAYGPIFEFLGGYPG